MRLSLLLVFSLLMLIGHEACADDVVHQQLHIKNHVFVPREMNVPAGQKVKLTISNEDPTPAEFESYELHREKVVAANGSIVVFVGPLDAGTYPFFDDFHRDTTTGSLIAK